MTSILRASALRRVFRAGAGDVVALDDVSLTVERASFAVVRGRSGSGKTTLLNILGGLDHPTSGTVEVAGRDLGSLDENGLVEIRREHLGFIFQSFGLIPVLTAAENVEVPLRIRRLAPAERDERVAQVLEIVGLGPHAAQRPYELSGGQQQRVGIARALVGRPSVLIADEPTGQLDSGTAEVMMDLFRRITREQGVAAIISTHDPLLVRRADSVHELHDGRLTSSVVAR